MDEPISQAVFIVRLSRDSARRSTGVVERVRTGQKIRFDRLAAIGDVVRLLLEGDPDELPDAGYRCGLT